MDSNNKGVHNQSVYTDKYIQWQHTHNKFTRMCTLTITVYTYTITY